MESTFASDLPLDSKYSRAVLELLIKLPYQNRVIVYRSKAYLREDGWYPCVEEWVNGQFHNALEYDFPMDDPKVALTIAYSAAKEYYNMAKERWESFCGGFLETNVSKPTENIF